MSEGAKPIHLPKMGRPIKPRPKATGFIGEPLAVGCVVIGLTDVVSIGLFRNKAARVLRVEEKRICPGGPLRFFYELEGTTGAHVLFDYVKVAAGICVP